MPLSAFIRKARNERRVVSAWPVYLRQLASGVCYLHGVNVIHADLKPGNVVASPGGFLKIIDVGSALVNLPTYRRKDKECKDGLQFYCTLWYRAPELILGDITFGMPIDVWSCGCIAYELLIGKVTAASSTALCLVEIISLCGSPDDATLAYFARLPAWSPGFARTHYASRLSSALEAIVPPAWAKLICCLLVLHPHKRASIDQVLVSRRARHHLTLKLYNKEAHVCVLQGLVGLIRTAPLRNLQTWQSRARV